MTEFVETPQGRRIALNRHSGKGPTLVFLGGFRSDMTGTKAMYLEDWAWRRGQAFIRFDYSGHGASGGDFLDGSIGDWAADAAAVVNLVAGPLVLVGSSMGGWISLLLARAMPERIAGLVTIAGAPDFTEDLMWAGWDAETRARLIAEGVVHEPSVYGAPYPITRRLIEEARGHLIFGSALELPFPTRILQGADDADVPAETALRLFAHAGGPDIRLTLVKGADHRFSSPDCLEVIARAAAEVCGG